MKITKQFEGKESPFFETVAGANITNRLYNVIFNRFIFCLYSEVNI